MSVINRMLRDLDQRQQMEAQAHHTPAALSPEPWHWSRIVLAMVGATVAVIFILGVLWSIDTGDDESVEPVTHIPQPVTDSTSIDAEAKTAADELEIVAEPVAKPAVALQPGPIITEEQREQAIQAADVQSQPNVPIDNESSPDLSQEMVAEVSSVPTDTDKEVSTAVELETLSSKTTPLSNSTPQPTPIVIAENATANNVEDEKSFAVDRVNLSADEIVAGNLAKARKALRSGDRERAQEWLEQGLMMQPENVAVRSELAAYWFGRGFANRAVALLQQGLELSPQESQWQLLLARIYERMGRIESGYGVLQRGQPGSKDYNDILELRAHLAMQIGKYSSAATDYVELAKATDAGRYWLSAAVAAEDSGNIRLAIQAYAEAAKDGNLPAAGRDYAAQRLNALGGG